MIKTETEGKKERNRERPLGGGVGKGKEKEVEKCSEEAVAMEERIRRNKWGGGGSFGRRSHTCIVTTNAVSC